MTESTTLNLMTLPLEIRLNIWRLCICPYAEADCCEQAIPNSSRRLLSNPWYPTPILPTFKYPQARTPLRLINHQANTELKSHLPLPPLIARVCDYMCMRRALSVLSNRTSIANEIDLAHITAFKVTSERMSLHRPLYSSTGEETGFTVSLRSSEPENNARILRNAQTFIKLLQGQYREVRLAHSRWEDMDGRPFTVEVQMLYEVGGPYRTVVCGSGARVVVPRGV